MMTAAAAQGSGRNVRQSSRAVQQQSRMGAELLLTRMTPLQTALAQLQKVRPVATLHLDNAHAATFGGSVGLEHSE